jgi:hypothetical protein
MFYVVTAASVVIMYVSSVIIRCGFIAEQSILPVGLTRISTLTTINKHRIGRIGLVKSETSK